MYKRDGSTRHMHVDIDIPYMHMWISINPVKSTLSGAYYQVPLRTCLKKMHGTCAQLTSGAL